MSKGRARKPASRRPKAQSPAKGTPQDRSARLDAALAEQHKGNWSAALTTYRALLDEDPTYADAWHLMGTAAQELGQHDMAYNFMAKAIQLNPRRHSYHHNIASVHSAFGRFDKAKAHFHEAIRLRPDCADAYYNLANITRFAADDPFVTAVESLLTSESASEVDRCLLHFAAGKYYDDVGDSDRAFPHYREGNRAKGWRFKPDRSRQRVAATKDAFPAGVFADRAGQGVPSEAPVYVFGMPRSGTSLVEQMLSAHPAIHGAGELGDVTETTKALSQAASGAPFPGCVAVTPAPRIAQAAQVILQRLAGLAPTAQRVINKSPLNFWYLGLIRLMLPQAQFIHVRRDPRDTCLSCYFHNFRRNNEFSFDLEDLGHYYRAYEEIMAYWREVLPRPPLEVRYEALVAQPEKAAREMLAFLGLEWDAACLEPHRVERTVLTSSRWQVRQPITRAAIGRWRPYERHLAPLLDVLGPIPAGDAPGAPTQPA